MCWDGEGFNRAEMCQSCPCLSDHSFIWSFALTLRSDISPLICFSLSFSLSLTFYILPPPFHSIAKNFVHLKFMHFHTNTHSWPPVTGVVLESCWPSQVNVVERGYVNTSSPFDTPLPPLSWAKPHIWQPPRGLPGSFHYEHMEVRYRNNSHLEITLSSFSSPVLLFFPFAFLPFSNCYFRCYRVSSFTFTRPETENAVSWTLVSGSCGNLTGHSILEIMKKTKLFFTSSLQMCVNYFLISNFDSFLWAVLLHLCVITLNPGTSWMQLVLSETDLWGHVCLVDFFPTGGIRRTLQPTQI